MATTRNSPSSNPSLIAVRQQFISDKKMTVSQFFTLYTRFASEGLQIKLPDNFNLAELIKQIAQLPCWNDKRTTAMSWLFNSSYPPAGIDEIRQTTPQNLSQLAAIARNHMQGGRIQAALREQMTSEFYDLIVQLAELAICDGVRFAGIESYCQRWADLGLQLPMTITPLTQTLANSFK